MSKLNKGILGRYFVNESYMETGSPKKLNHKGLFPRPSLENIPPVPESYQGQPGLSPPGAERCFIWAPKAHQIAVIALNKQSKTSWGEYEGGFWGFDRTLKAAGLWEEGEEETFLYPQQKGRKPEGGLGMLPSGNVLVQFTIPNIYYGLHLYSWHLLGLSGAVAFGGFFPFYHKWTI